METAIELKNVCKAFGANTIYENVDLMIGKGECVGFVGGTGTGKSVLFQIITGLMKVDDGTVVVNGEILGKNGQDFPDNVGILINEPGYIEYYSGYKNLQLLAEIQGKIDDKKIQETMTMVGLDYKDKTPVKKYSMGMKQKLGIAQAIMENQEIVILDEPYNALDYKSNKEITKILEQLKEVGKTLLITSHQHEYLKRLCDRLYCISDHKVVPFTEEMQKKYFGYGFE